MKTKSPRVFIRVNRTSILITLSVVLLLNTPTLSLGAFHIDNGKTENNEDSRKEAKPSKATAGEKSGTETPSTRAGTSLTTDEQLQQLRDKIQTLEELLQRQQKIVEALQNQKTDGLATSSDTGRAGMTSTEASAAVASTATAGSVAKPVVQKNGDVSDSPLQFHIGSAYVTPVGFMDFTEVFRTTTGGSGIGTNFGGIPFNNTPAGHLTESRFSAQNSRIGLRVDALVHDAHVIGYLESDFLGPAPGNVAVSSNSDPLRLRLYLVDVTRGKFEMLAGQSWSMMTPGRKGISPLPGDLFFSQDIDVNYQLGLTWSRQPQFRLIYHANDKVALGLSLEAPEQYIGGSAGGGTITLPSAINASGAYANQLDNGNTTLNAPNVHPDIVGKLAFDPKLGSHDFHLEFDGVVRSFRVFNPLNGKTFTSTGGGGSVNANLELLKNFRLITNNFISDGGGRYIFGQAPDLVIRGDGSPSLVHSYSNVSGIEAQVNKNLLLYGYYGGAYIQRNAVIDPANGKPVGYGFSGSSSGQNRAIQEGTLGFTQTFWRDPKYGALQFMGQYSYLDRRPWFVAAGQPKVAHNNMIFLNIRYVLPGSAPKIDNSK